MITLSFIDLQSNKGKIRAILLDADAKTDASITVDTVDSSIGAIYEGNWEGGGDTSVVVENVILYGKSGAEYPLISSNYKIAGSYYYNFRLWEASYNQLIIPVFIRINKGAEYGLTSKNFDAYSTGHDDYSIVGTQPTKDKFGFINVVKKRTSISFGVSGAQYDNGQTNSYRQFLKDVIDGASVVGDTDPYKNGGSTTDGGGGGTFGGGNTIFGGASDSVDIPPLPTASASDAGFITLFNPSLAQLNNLANYMWSDLFSLDTFKKIFADPMDCILGLSIVPVKPASAGTSTVKIGNVSTDVSMNKTSSQYVAVDCGTIDVKEYWGAYLDYAPYTQCEIYLPYVGTKHISVDDVMNKAVRVVYHVDILSGACNAYVKCGDSVLYTFVGQCSSSIPISGNDWTNVLNGAISVAGKLGLAMATGGATALMSGLGAASSIISSSKPTVERSGAMSSTGGLLGIQKPYLILTRPKQALPENQNKYTGYPSFITMALSDCTGYTEIDSIHLENMICTDEEAQEIENLLKSGVIF